MKFILVFFISIFSYSQTPKTNEEIEKNATRIVQNQLESYNKLDVEAFLESYSDSVKVYRFPTKLLYKGKEKMKEQYSNLFKKYPELNCTVNNRIVKGNTVIDQESIILKKSQPIFKAIVIYKVKDEKIVEVYFVD